MTPVLEVENLDFSFDSDRIVLSGIGFSVSEGESVGIVGANGAGKSTLLWCLVGLLKASGSVRLFGEKPARKHLRRIGFVFQNPEDQLFMPSLVQDVALTLVNRGVPAGEASEKALEALALVGLRNEAQRPASHLSLGQRKRASVAAALVASPDLLLLDEPTAELDGRSVRQLTEVLRHLTIAKVIASHHLEFLDRLCSRILVLLDGRIVEDGPADRILRDTSLLERAGLV
jgi:cobalt/nickel transport system ATP-binding protein